MEADLPQMGMQNALCFVTATKKKSAAARIGWISTVTAHAIAPQFLQNGTTKALIACQKFQYSHNIEYINAGLDYMSRIVPGEPVTLAINSIRQILSVVEQEFFC